MPQSADSLSVVRSAFPASYFPGTSSGLGGVPVIPSSFPDYVARFDPSGANTVTTISVPDGAIVSDIPAASYTGDLNALLEYTINNSFTPPRREFSVPTSVTGLPLSVFTPATYIAFFDDPAQTTPVIYYNISNAQAFLQVTVAEYGSVAALDRGFFDGNGVQFGDPSSPTVALPSASTNLPARIYPQAGSGAVPTQAELKSPLYAERWVPTLSPIVPAVDYNSLWNNAPITAEGSEANFRPLPPRPENP